MTTTLEEVQEAAVDSDLVGTSQDAAISAFWDNSPDYNATLDAAEFLENFAEAYAGDWDNDRYFAESLADDMGFEQPDSWPYNCIDWEHAARELMYDYWESGGHYFRNI